MQKTSEEKPVSGGAIICNASGMYINFSFHLFFLLTTHSFLLVGGVRSGGGPMSYSASKAA